jgi:hypothetical protein
MPDVIHLLGERQDLEAILAGEPVDLADDGTARL